MRTRERVGRVNEGSTTAVAVALSGAACLDQESRPRIRARVASGPGVRLSIRTPMPRLWIQTTLFLSSYLPVFALVGLRSIDRSWWVVGFCAVVCLLGAVGTTLFLVTAKRRNVLDVVLLDVESRDSDLAAYLVTYLLPFVTVFSSDWQDLASLAGFIVILGVVYVRSRLIYLNPTLALLGYQLDRVIPATPGTEKDATLVRWPRYVLTQSRSLAPGERIRAREVTPDLLIYAPDGGR
jgi:hypothetical protein